MKNTLVFLFCILFSINHLAAQKDFIAAPYLQIGYAGNPKALSLLWHSDDTTSDWKVEVKTKNTWVKSKELYFNKVNIKDYSPFVVYHAALENLENGIDFTYRVIKKKKYSV